MSVTLKEQRRTKAVGSVLENLRAIALPSFFFITFLNSTLVPTSDWLFKSMTLSYSLY